MFSLSHVQNFPQYESQKPNYVIALTSAPSARTCTRKKVYTYLRYLSVESAELQNYCNEFVRCIIVCGINGCQSVLCRVLFHSISCFKFNVYRCTDKKYVFKKKKKQKKERTAYRFNVGFCSFPFRSETYVYYVYVKIPIQA